MMPHELGTAADAWLALYAWLIESRVRRATP